MICCALILEKNSAASDRKLRQKHYRLSPRTVVADIDIESTMACFSVLTDRSCMPFGSYQDYIGIVGICIDLICAFIADQHTTWDRVVAGELCDTYRSKSGRRLSLDPNTIGAFFSSSKELVRLYCIVLLDVSNSSAISVSFIPSK